MEETNALKKNELSRGEVVLMAIVTPLIFCALFAVSFCLIVYVLGGIGGSGGWFCGQIGFFVILGFDVAWVFIIRLLFKKYKKTKILFMTMGFAVSTAALIIWILDTVNIRHMFG